MADEVQKFERHRLQLTMSLTALAENMRSSAAIAESFANIIENMHYPVGSHVEQNGVKAGKKRKAVALTEDGEGTPANAKRARKPKDPNAPKRPPSAYIMYQNDIRKELKEQHPNVTNSELLGIIAKQWAEMPESDKAVYGNLVANAKVQYSEQMKAYEARSPQEVESANAAIAAAAALKKATPRSRAPKTKVAAVAAPPPKIAVTESTTSDDEDDEEEASDDEDTPEREKEQKKNEIDSDSSSDEEDEADEEEDEDDKPIVKKAKTKVVTPVTPAPRGKEKEKEIARKKKLGKA